MKKHLASTLKRQPEAARCSRADSRPLNVGPDRNTLVQGNGHLAHCNTAHVKSTTTEAKSEFDEIRHSKKKAVTRDKSAEPRARLAPA